MKYPEIAGKKVLVTGGTRGIGYQISQAFCDHGAEVHVTGTKKQGKHPSGAIYHACDFTEQGELDSFCASLGELGIQILVNNAGVNSPAPFADIASAEFLRVQQVNLYAPFRVCQAVLSGMQSARWGRIVNISSLAGLSGQPYITAYCASKHAVIGLTRTLALEVVKKGITVNAVCPAYVETGMVERGVDNIRDITGMSEEEARGELAKKSPQNRIIMPSEVGATVAWLCLPGSESITGQSIAMAGGAWM